MPTGVHCRYWPSPMASAQSSTAHGTTRPSGKPIGSVCDAMQANVEAASAPSQMPYKPAGSHRHR